MPVIDFKNTKQIFFGGSEIKEVWFGGQKLWERPQVATQHGITDMFLFEAIYTFSKNVTLNKALLEKHRIDAMNVLGFEYSGIQYNLTYVRSDEDWLVFSLNSYVKSYISPSEQIKLLVSK